MEDKFTDGSGTLEGTQQLMHYISRPGITEEEVKNLYNIWAAKYNQVRLCSTNVHEAVICTGLCIP